MNKSMGIIIIVLLVTVLGYNIWSTAHFDKKIDGVYNDLSRRVEQSEGNIRMDIGDIK